MEGLLTRHWVAMAQIISTLDLKKTELPRITVGVWRRNSVSRPDNLATREPVRLQAQTYFGFEVYDRMNPAKTEAGVVSSPTFTLYENDKRQGFIVSFLRQLETDHSVEDGSRVQYATLLSRTIVPHLDLIQYNFLASFVDRLVSRFQSEGVEGSELLFFVNGGMSEDLAFNLAYVPLPEKVTIACITTSIDDVLSNRINPHNLDIGEMFQESQDDPTDGWRVLGPFKNEEMHLVSHSFLSSGGRQPQRLDLFCHPELPENWQNVSEAHLNRCLHLLSVEFVQTTDPDPVTHRAFRLPKVLVEARSTATKHAKTLNPDYWPDGGNIGGP